MMQQNYPKEEDTTVKPNIDGSQTQPNYNLNQNEEPQPRTWRQIKFGQQETQILQQGKEIIRLNEQIKAKDQEIRQKNQIIKQLQDRCVLVNAYQKKIINLQSKIGKLEHILDRLEKNSLVPIGQRNKEQLDSKKNNIEHPLGQKNQCNLQNKKKSRVCSILNYQKSQSQSKQKKKLQNSHSIYRNKQNIQNLQASQQRVDKNSSKEYLSNPNQQQISKIQSKQHLNVYKNAQQITSSKFLPGSKCQNEEQSEKYKNINAKFNKMKQNIDNKPKSTKNIEQIYSIINNHKVRGQELVVKQINKKLQNILNQSQRLNSQDASFRQRSKSRSREHELSFSIGSNNRSYEKPQWKIEMQRKYSQINTQRPKSQNYSFCNLNLLNSSTNTTRNFNESIRTQRKYQNYSHNNSNQLLYRPSKIQNTSFSKMDNNKFNKILNATNVDQMLKARKTHCGYETLIKSSGNRPTEINLKKYDRNIYRK